MTSPKQFVLIMMIAILVAVSVDAENFFSRRRNQKNQQNFQRPLNSNFRQRLGTQVNSARKAKKFLTPLITSFFRNQGASNYLNGARDLQPQLSGSNRDSAAATYAAAAPAYGIFLILYEQVSRIKVCE